MLNPGHNEAVKCPAKHQKRQKQLTGRDFLLLEATCVEQYKESEACLTALAVC